MKSMNVLFFVSLPLVASAVYGEVRFDRDIRPILADRCFQCHGPADADREADLRLDQAEGTDGAYRESAGTIAIQPGSLEQSEVWTRITSRDPDLVMPPLQGSKPPLSASEIAMLKKWIEQGAPYEDFWAFVPPTAPKFPQDVQGTPIDRFVLRKLKAEGLDPSPRADKRTLIRRVTFDLTGLPPTREEIHAFIEDDSLEAYENVVDRLLQSPHFGEHLAKFWLDLVRFADTNGIHHDHYRDLSSYRDWVIRSFNANLPYDDFTRYQLAGDLYPEPTRDQLIASGFHRLHLIIDRGTALPEESFTRNVLDRVTSVGTAFLGITVQCVVCHDHKYDPMTMKDFYSLSAFFNNIDAAPETGGRNGSDFLRGLQTPYINLTDQRQEARLAELDAQVDGATVELERLKKSRQEVGEDEEKKAEMETLLKDGEKHLNEATQARNDYLITIPAAMVMKERSDQRPAHVLIRGAYDHPGEQVSRDTPKFLPPMKNVQGEKNRMDLANWFVDPEHPLTARVTVNRFWQQLFGVGIVKTSEDFGAQGEWPTHPDLLDYLAVRFVDSGWDVKGLMREIVLSDTYQQSSYATPKVFQQDPQNRLLARGSRFRMDSEMIRDQILSSSGLLNPELFGKSVKPPQPDGLWKAVGMPSSYPAVFVADEGDKILRRSIYTFWKRGMPPPQMTILNAPSREVCTTRRERTNTPLQALLLLNEPEYLRAARQLAFNVLAAPESSSPGQIDVIVETVTSHLPTPSERQNYLKLVTDLSALYLSAPELAEELCENETPPEGVTMPEWAAWTMLTSTIYNLDVTKTRQ